MMCFSHLPVRLRPALLCCLLLALQIDAALGKDDPRKFENGHLIPTEGYCDQPYLVRTTDGNWLLTMTTGPGHESQPGQHMVATISTDKGRTWSKLIDIEPSDGPEASWGSPFVTPGGRVYVFYDYNGDRIKERDGRPVSATLGGWYVFKYSDDHGRTWSAERHRLPLPVHPRLDINNGMKGTFQCFWGIDEPEVFPGGKVLFAFTRMGKFSHELGEGWLYSSDNLLTEKDPAKLQWTLLPASGQGIRGEAFGSVQEEHNVVPLSNGGVYCIFRTQKGYACDAYSRDGGATWSEPKIATYQPGGRTIKNPMACARVWKMANGKYLLWFHNTSSPLKGTAAPLTGRNLGWLCGGIEKDGIIHWSEPELVNYNGNRRKGSSYPDILEEDGEYYLSNTNKNFARLQQIDRTLIEGLWKEDHELAGTRDGLVAELTAGREMPMPRLPNLAEEGGFTIDFWLRLDDIGAGQVLLDSRDASGRGLVITTTDQRALEFSMSDGTVHTSWTSDPGLLRAGQWQHWSCLVDGGPKLIAFVTDGRLTDGGDNPERPYGYGRFFPAENEKRVVTGPLIGDVSGGPTLKIAPSLHGTISGLRIYDRALRIAEARGNFLTGQPQ